MTQPIPELVDGIVERIKPILAGRGPDVVGPVLADLMAIWLTSHQGLKDEELHELRKKLLRLHVKMVWQLVPLYDEVMRHPHHSQ